MSVGKTLDVILHDIIAGGVLAASIFVKNPKSQQTAATLIQAVNQLLPMLDSQLNPQNVTVTTPPATTPAQ